MCGLILSGCMVHQKEVQDEAHPNFKQRNTIYVYTIFNSASRLQRGWAH